MLSEREAAVDRVLGELRVLLIGADRREMYELPITRDATRRAVGRARMHLDTATEQLERAVEYVSILEDRLDP